MIEVDSKVYERIGKEKIEQVSKPVGGSLQGCFPKILAVRAADTFLGHQNGGKEHYKNAYVKHPEKIFGRDALAQKRADVHPEAEKETDQGEKGKEGDKWPEPSRKRIEGEPGFGGIGRRRPIAEQSLDGRFEEKRAARLVRMVLHEYRLA
jgi:hypothetical protein